MTSTASMREKLEDVVRSTLAMDAGTCVHCDTKASDIINHKTGLCFECIAGEIMELYA